MQSAVCGYFDRIVAVSRVRMRIMVNQDNDMGILEWLEVWSIMFIETSKSTPKPAKPRNPIGRRALQFIALMPIDIGQYRQS